MTNEINGANDNSDMPSLPAEKRSAKIARGALQVVSGTVPFAGGLLSAAAGAWSEAEQEKVNRFFEHWLRMLQDELKEKQETIVQVVARLNLQDDIVAKRVESREYQSLLKKTFREWSGAESDEKRIYIRNILANAAATQITSDDVIRMFIGWINVYSELHFRVIGAIYNNAGITRGEIWRRIGKNKVREDSADADLYKLLIRDLSMGSIIRQHRDVDYGGNFMAKTPQPRHKFADLGTKPMVSAFDEVEGYELTGLGEQFVHYAMTELPLRVTFSGGEFNGAA